MSAINQLGLSEFSMGAGSGYPYALVIQPDQKIVIAGHLNNVPVIARINQNGSIDTSFGNAGIAIVGSLGLAGNGSFLDLAIDQSGKIVAGGYVGGSAIVVRFNQTGQIDQQYGLNGLAVIPANQPGQYDVRAVGLQSTGKVIVSGIRNSNYGSNFVVSRFDNSGSIDTTFSTNGIQEIDFNTWDYSWSAKIQQDDKIVVVGVAASGSGNSVAVVRLDPDGQLDSTFGAGGKTTFQVDGKSTEGRVISLSNDGSIIIGGWFAQAIPNTLSVAPNLDFFVARLSPSGSLDQNFGANGFARTDFGSMDGVFNLLSFPDGSIIAAGLSKDDPTTANATPGGFKLAVVKFNAQGQIDQTFGNSGAVTLNLANSQFWAVGLGKSNDSKVVFSSQTGSGSTVTVGKLDSVGNLDQTFNPICFAVGTKVTTDTGLVEVQQLKVGDYVHTSDGIYRRVLWIGQQRRTPEFAQFQDYLPVKISAGALDDNVPLRDLYLSPDHAVLVDGHLIHAKALVNGKTIVQMTEWAGDIEYYHIETEGHEIIYAEGVPCETFIDNVSRRQFDNYDEYEAMFGDERVMTELDLPRVKFKRQLPQAIAQRLEVRAQALAIKPKASDA